MIGKEAERVLNRAVGMAFRSRHEYFTLEHVLMSLLQEKAVLEVLNACGALPDAIQSDLKTYLKNEVPQMKPAQASTSGSIDGANESQKTEKIPGEQKKSFESEHPVATLSIQRMIQRALFHVQSAGKDEIKPIDLLIALFQAKDSYSLFVLEKASLQRLDIINFVSHGVRKDPENFDAQSSQSSSSSDEEPQGIDPLTGDHQHSALSPSSEDPLKIYATNLNERASQHKIDPLIGRKKELERMIQTLCRRRKNNPLLVGEAGVGKTALAEGLALQIVNQNVPEPIKNSVVYSLDLGALIAGAKFRGDFEQRFKRVLGSIEKKQKQGVDPILFIDEIHMIIGAGSVSGGVLDAANLLKPLLAKGEIKCIGSTTYQEYRSHIEKDHALSRRFQRIEVNEPSIDESVEILNGLKDKYEAFHSVQYTPEALRAAVELSQKHITDRFLPDKAIDVIDESGARARLTRKEQRPIVDVSNVEEMVSSIARIPARQVTSSQKERLKTLDQDLKLAIFGQDSAIEAVVTSIRLARSGLRSGDKPVGSFLFCGPTGVGKTELSRQLAHFLGIPLIRFDMSEYGEKHTVSRLIGAPPGYVGFDQPGLLTEAAIKNPYSVVLLDEIEKAHPDVWNILLQVMDHGTLTDNNGKKADYRNVVLLMTSNVGSRDLDRRTVGFASDESDTKASSKEVERTFSPEFRNRLDGIVYFNQLTPEAIIQVVSKELSQLESQLLSKQIEVDFSKDLKKWLAEKGFDKRLGARPLSRLIQEEIKKPLSKEILFGKLENGGRVKIKIQDLKLVFDITSTPVNLAKPSKVLKTENVQ